jgi:hypothetical protein
MKSDGVIRCQCPDKKWNKTPPVRADEETERLLKQKGFNLAPCGWYYYGQGSSLLTVYQGGSWDLDDGNQPPIKTLNGFLLSLPDA